MFKIALKIALLLFCFLSISLAGGKKKTVITYITETWQENDYFGSGAHFVIDKIRPNISLLVHKVDGEISDLVGVPNNNQAGDSDDLDGSAFGAYDPLNILTRIDFSQKVADRGYGNWFNDERIWDISKNYLDSKGKNFCELDPKMFGERGTRYRFTVNIEDNTPFWYKDDSGMKMYFPYDIVIFRISEVASGINPETEAFDNTGAKDEFILIKEGRDFLMDDVPTQYRLRNGRFTYNFTTYHTFQQAKEYNLIISARDLEQNERILVVKISMDQLSGIQLQNSNFNTIKDSNF